MADPSALIERLTKTAWARSPRAVEGEALSDLTDLRYLDFTNAPPEEGGVRQHGYQAYLPYGEAPAVVQEFGDKWIEHLSRAASAEGLPRIPAFNEASWFRYPEGVGYITAHLDPLVFRGVIAILSLTGSALFRVWEGKSIQAIQVAAGDLVLVCGTDWPNSAARGPRHEVHPPTDEDRLIMTLRHNARGANGGYDV